MQEKIINLLSDGLFHSGEELGARLGVSRTAVWKQLKKLEEVGVALESVKGRGYRLPLGFHLLNQDSIISGLSDSAFERFDKIEVLSVVDSTNARILQQLSVKAGCYLSAAERQTAGRGRRGRVWHSPYGRNLYFSVSYVFQGGVSAIEGLSLAVGVALCDALRDLGITGVELKWPNDLVCQHRKLGGILLEMSGDAEGPCNIVVGVGINVAMSDHDGVGITQPWIDLQSLRGGLALDRNVLLVCLVNHLVAVLDGFESTGFSSYRDRWLALDAFVGKKVSVHIGENQTIGVAGGVDESGALLLRTEEGVQAIRGGEVTLRMQVDS